MIWYGYGHGSWLFAVFAIGMLVLRRASHRGGRGRSRNGVRHRDPDARSAGRLWSADASPAPDRTDRSDRVDAGGTRVRIPPGRMVDPTGRYEERYWSGTVWTEHVRTNGVPATDPPPAG